MFSKSLSIQAKITLVILITSGSALLVAGGLFLIYDLKIMSSTLVENLKIMAGIVGASSDAAVTFQDPAAAENNLRALRANPHVLSAEIKLPDGSVLARYERTGPLQGPDTAAATFHEDRVTLPSPIVVDGQSQGTVTIVSDLEGLEEQRRRYVIFFGATFAGLSMLAILLSARLQRLISRPILSLADTARSVSAQKNYSLRAEKTSSDEVGTLVEVFNEMLARIQERDHELQTANRELARRNEDNEMFVYSVSHDLRGPLVNLQGFSKELSLLCPELKELLEKSSLPPDEKGRASDLIDNDIGDSLRYIQAAVMRLSGIIDAMLRLSRAGRVVYQHGPVDVGAIVNQVVSSLQDSITKNGAQVEVRPLPPAWGDATALDQLFGNLVSNALKYLSPSRPGKIGIGASEAQPPDGSVDRSTGKWTTYYVRDNGLGIPVEHRQKLFRAFQRLHPGVAEGEGIGLALVRRIVERHGGAVWIESEVDQGTTVYAALPRPKE